MELQIKFITHAALRYGHFNLLVSHLQIEWGACGLALTGNTILFITIFGFFVVFGRGDEFSWEQW